MTTDERGTGRSVVCTICEGDYHLGVAVLVNSLHASGFRGDLWLGLRGPLPPWLVQGEKADEKKGTSFDGICIKCFQIEFDCHLTNFKPRLFSSVWGFDPKAERIFYFDPDIVLVAPWAFFEKWADSGVALCADCTYPVIPADHPHRFIWQNLLHEEQMVVNHHCDRYYNGGFLGLARRFKSFVDDWERLLFATVRHGANLAFIKNGERENPYQIPDQDSLNVAAMGTQHPLSTIGPDGMDFDRDTGYIMRHAVDGPKPWRCWYVARQLSKGIKPSRAHKDYWRNTLGPIRPISRARCAAANLDIKIALGINRFYRH